MTGRIASLTSRRPLVAVALWGVAIVAAVGLIGALLSDGLTSEEWLTNNPESGRAHALSFDPAIHASEVVIVRSRRWRVEEPPFRRRIELLATELGGAGATNVETFYDRGEQRLVSADRGAMRLPIVLGADAEERIERVVATVENARGPWFDTTITGEWTLRADLSTLADEDLRRGELAFGLPAALIILLLVFGAAVAALVPVAMALASIVIALALAALVGQVFQLSLFVVNMISVMGLALGIDYSLFVLSRYREERANGRREREAIVVAGANAGRAVLFSGVALVLAMLGLLLVPDTTMRSVAAGAILAGLVSVLAAITLLPALLGLLGDRVNSLRIPLFGRPQRPEGSRAWSRLVHGVMRRPVLYLVLAGGALLAVATPVLGLSTGESGIGSIPDRMPSKQGFVALGQEFPGETADPVTVVLVGPVGSGPVRRGIKRLETALADEQSLGAPSLEPNRRRDASVLTLPVAGDPRASAAINAVRELRSRHAPRAFEGTGAEVLVGGTTAEQIDENDTHGRWLPIVLAFVLALSFVLLTVAFRSIVVPAKAVVLNLLSVGAAYGLLVIVFQHGVGSELLGFQQVDAIEPWLPLFLFAVLFALSMDYEVFLLSRIRERFVRTRDNSDAVAHGVIATGRIITGAALIIVVVFIGFARGDLVMFQQLGFGVAAALVIDATLVRLVLVPAAMELLGSRNWYLPRWLAWLPDARVEGEEAAGAPIGGSTPLAEPKEVGR